MTTQQSQAGAEAVLTFSKESVRKERVPKGYRHPELDTRLRTIRNRREIKVLEKCPVRCPKIIDSTETSITMERIEGIRVRDALTIANAESIGEKLGKMLLGLHAANIIHGDLTTSNVLFETATEELVLIDFGLSSFSKRNEDRAVDLHVLRETLEGSHPTLKDTLWKGFIRGYTDSVVLSVLEKVEQRGRYKAKY